MLGEEAAVASVTLGLGTALVYPTLLASVSDGAAPSWRASAILTVASGLVVAGRMPKA
jgi:hypothetical protein